MLLTVTILLGLGLGFALLRLQAHHRAVRRLRTALFTRQPLLRDGLPGSLGPAWESLRATSTELITEANRLQQLRSSHLAQLEATLGSLQEAVLIVDENNYIILANKALKNIFPRVTNILTQRLERVLQSAIFLNYVEAVRKGEGAPRHEIEFVESSRSVWLEATGTAIPPLNSQQGPWVLFVLHDITQQKKLEAVRKDFVANVSHELRTPLSVIKGYIETLVDGHRDIPLDDRERFLKTVQRHTERLNSLLEDLLTLSRLESLNPGLRRESTDLAALIADVIADYRARPAAEGHRLGVAIDPAVGNLLIDPLKVTQVLDNLLDNALKYTPQGSHLDVSARLRGSEVEVCVRDNGPGIPAEDLPHIFKRFYRVDKGRSRDKGGTGLGLSIAKHIVQLHGGRVWVESAPGQGSAFHFSLPLRTNG
jgi:two-component system phosphate regulon sensor histidine kinase PhoR